MKVIIYILAGIFLAGCIQNEPQIKVLQVESWTDLMPGTPGKTYLQARFSISDAESETISVTGIKVISAGGEYILKEAEYEFSTASGDSNKIELALRGVFLFSQKDVDTMNAEVRFSINDSELKYMLEKVPVEKVY